MILLTSVSIFVLLGALFVLVGVPLVRGRVGPNPWYGVRVRKTLEDPAVWYAVNAYFGRRFVVAGVLVAALAVLLSPIGLFGGVGSVTYITLCKVILISGVTYCALDTFRYLRRF